MSVRDARVVAMLTLLRDELAPVVDELVFGELSAEDRRTLARALRRVADALEPDTVVLLTANFPEETRNPDDHRQCIPTEVTVQ